MKIPGPVTIGLDLGGTNMVAGVVDAGGRIHARTKVPTWEPDGPAVILRRMAAEILEVWRASGLPKRAVRAVGIGSPGPLNARTGEVLDTPNLSGWKRVPVTRTISRLTGFKAFLENDANAAAVGEAAYGAGKGCANVVVLTLGTGVGGGVILDHKLLSGPDTTAGELGHMALDPRGHRCGCGQLGCLETYASATALARRARELAGRARKGPLWKLCGGDVSRITAKMAHQALEMKDPSAQIVWGEASWALGTAIAGYLNIFNPDRVILAGGVMQGGSELLRAVREIARSKAFPQPARRAGIVRATLGDDAGLIGAAVIARRGN